MRSRSGTSSRLASVSTMSALGRDRPVSTKLRCRVETAGFQRQLELTETTALAPIAEHRAHPCVGGHDHERTGGGMSRVSCGHGGTQAGLGVL